MVDLAAHYTCLAQHRLPQVGCTGAGGIGDDSERRLQGMGQVARVAARFLRLQFRMFEQGVQFIHHRLHFQRQRVCHPVAAGGADVGNRLAHPAQGAKPIPGLCHGHQEQADAQHREGPGDDGADIGQLRVKFLAAAGDHELPLQIASRNAHCALYHAQGFVRRLHDIVEGRLFRDHAVAHVQRGIPQRARVLGHQRIGGEILAPLRADLPVEAAVRFQEALIAQPAIEIDFAEGIGFR